MYLCQKRSDMKRFFKKSVMLFVGVVSLLFGCQHKNAYKTVETQEFATLISSPDVQLVDVRTKAEFDDFHIEGAINIDVKSADFTDKALQILNKEKTVAVYCRTGVRSANAASMLSSKGFKVVNLSGGITKWQSDGFSVN